MNRQTVRLILVFVVVLAASGLLSYYLFGRRDEAQTPPAGTNTARPAAQQSPATAANNDAAPPLPTDETRPAQASDARTQQTGGSSSGSLFSEIFGAERIVGAEGRAGGLGLMALRIILRFALASLLASLLAFRPRRRRVGLLQRSPYVAQTQILLAIVAAALMLVVGDSAARAFGIFAAASLVRFRTNISDPKEITVLLISLGIGLATGVGHWEVAVILCLFTLLTLWVLEYYEPAQAFRAMELTVTTRRVDETNSVLKRVLRRHRLNTELREINREDESDPLGKIVYHVNVSLITSTDKLSSEIFSLDPKNIDSISWGQKKTPSIYS